MAINNISNLIIQWGLSIATTSTYGIKTINFPVSFNNATIVQLTGFGVYSAFTNTQPPHIATAQNDNVLTNSLTNTKFETQSWWTHYWFAVGY